MKKLFVLFTLLLGINLNGCFIEGCMQSPSGKNWGDAMSDEERVKLYAKWIKTLEKKHVVYDFSCTGEVTIFDNKTKTYHAIDSNSMPSQYPVWGPASSPIQVTAEAISGIHAIIQNMTEMDDAAASLAKEKFLNFIGSKDSTWQNALQTGQELIFGEIRCKQNYRGVPPSSISECKKAEVEPNNSGDTNVNPPPPSPSRTTLEQNCNGV